MNKKCRERLLEMKKLINNPENVVREMLSGVVQAHPELTKPQNINSLIYDNQRKVTLISGGGSGHEPLDLGYVGAGLLDAAVVGAPFTPPTADHIIKTAELFKQRTPVLFIVKNFIEDRREFAQAQEELIERGYQVQTLIVSDDVSIDAATKNVRRRGVAGTVLVHKILGAAASQGLKINELVTLGNQVNDNLYTLGVALSGVELPGANQPSFELTDDQIFYGIGIHGEPGYRKEDFKVSELLGRELVNKLVQVSAINPQDEVVILVNGLGNLPTMDNFIFTNDVVKLLQLKGIKPVLVKSGNLLSSYNMNGVSLTLLKIANSQWLDYLKLPVGGFAWV